MRSRSPYLARTLLAFHARAAPALAFAAMAVAAMTLAPARLGAQPPDRRPSPNNPSRPPEQQAPQGQPHERTAARFPNEVRTIDGTENNGQHPDWGAANTTFLRLLPNGYGDGEDSPAGAQRPSGRLISNVVSVERANAGPPSPWTGMFWQFGQFLDHDIDLTPIADPVEELDSPVPAGDRWFDPEATGTATISLDRSAYQERGGVRQQVNQITAFIDGSTVYGADPERARALRMLDGSGRLETSQGNLLPFNTEGLANAPDNSDRFFAAGDFRANEQVGLTSMHTLFLREHNYWATVFHQEDPTLNGDELYEKARAMVGAELQRITYREYLPELLGPNALPPYSGYHPDVNPGISNEFATAAFRFGHSQISGQMLRLAADGESIAEGPLSLAQAFFTPAKVVETGIEPILRGLVAQRSRPIDTRVVSEIRNFLFGPPGAGGFDLATLNIQRGRDHGMPSYTQARQALGLPPVASFADLQTDPQTRQRLTTVYGTPDRVDLWVGGLAERPVRRAAVGPTFLRILTDQFRRLRDGDRFWYQRYLPQSLLQRVEQQTLARIIRRNTSIGAELPDDVFRLPPPPPPPPPGN